MPYSTKSIFVGISVGVCTVLGTFLLRKWLQRYEQDTENRTQAPNNGKKTEKARRTTGAPTVDFYKLAPAVSVRNPQLSVLLKFLNEKSAFKAQQEQLRDSGCLTNVNKVLWNTSNPAIKSICFKILANIATNPDMLKDFIKPIVPLVFDTITKDQEDTDVLPNVLNLLVNITSHDECIMCEYNLRAIPQILSLYTPQINYQYDIVLSSLKILINMTCQEMVFDLTLVYMAMIHLLHGCRNNAILLRVLTLLRNILTSKSLKHDYKFDDELMRGIGTVLSCNEDKDCLDIANQIYRLISDNS
ncbi:hypothetical protein ACHWQZ_G004578 [Mnemiopsis leidyi]